MPEHLRNTPEPRPASANLPALIADTPRWLVLDKPAGWLTVPGRPGSKTDGPPVPVLSEWARGSFGKLWVVHRLDLETSGVILLAKSAEDHREANGWFERHLTRKFYDCLAQSTAAQPLPAFPVFKVKVPIDGRPATTQFEVKEGYREGFLARATPLTGKRHQIRIHLASKGHPLWGDRRYGGPAEIHFPSGRVMRISRVALHAARLEIPTGEVFTAPWSGDFSQWVEVLRKEGSRVGA